MEYPKSCQPQTVGPRNKVSIQSDVILNILQEIEDEAKGPKFKPHPPQKNYMKENFKRLREIQAQSQQKIAEKKPLQPLRVPNKYLETGRDLKRESQEHPKTAGPFRTREPCLSSNRRTCVSLPQLHRLDKQDEISPRSEADSEMTATSMKQGPEPIVKRPLGQIPTYLKERKKQWAREKERQKKKQEEASLPEGYTLLPDEERLETLDLLKKNQEELLQNLAALPVRNDTVRLRHYKEDLEKQLTKVEEGIKIFSRPKVLIKNDDS